jgi:hypothetical protein
MSEEAGLRVVYVNDWPFLTIVPSGLPDNEYEAAMDKNPDACPSESIPQAIANYRALANFLEENLGALRGNA